MGYQGSQFAGTRERFTPLTMNGHLLAIRMIGYAVTSSLPWVRGSSMAAVLLLACASASSTRAQDAWAC